MQATGSLWTFASAANFTLRGRPVDTFVADQQNNPNRWHAVWGNDLNVTEAAHVFGGSKSTLLS